MDSTLLFSQSLMSSEGGVTIVGLLLGALTIVSGVVGYLFRLLWAREREFSSLIIRSNQLHTEQTVQLQKIPEAIREHGERIKDYSATITEGLSRMERRMEMVEDATKHCPVRFSGSSG